MAKFQFRQTEEVVSIITFDADNYDHAVDLMEEVMDWAELPNSEIFHKNGYTDWDVPEESTEEENN